MAAAMALDPAPLPATSVWMYDPWCITPWYTAALTASLTAALRSAGCAVRLVAPRYHHEPAYFAQCGLRTQPGPLDLSTRLHLRPAALRQAARMAEYAVNTASLAATLRRRPPQVLHLQICPLLEQRFSIDLALLRHAQRRGVRCVHTVHNLLPHDARPGAAAAYRRLYQACDRLICHSADTATALERDFAVPPSRIDIIPHGPLFAQRPAGGMAEARAQLGIAPDRCVFLAQGVLSEYKGAGLLLEAWQAMLQRSAGTGARPLLIIAGRGPAQLEAELRAAVAKHRLQESVRLDLGYIPSRSIPAYFESADVLMYPYRRITTSGALLTGLCYNKPVIATDLAPFRALLRHGGNALLVPAGDVAALSAAMEQITLDPTLLHRLRCAAAGNAGRVPQWAAIARQTIESYHRAIA